MTIKELDKNFNEEGAFSMLIIKRDKDTKKAKSNNELKCLLLGLKYDVASMDGLPYLEQQFLLKRIEYIISRLDVNQVV